MTQSHVTKYFRKAKWTLSLMAAEQKASFHLYSRSHSRSV